MRCPLCETENVGAVCATCGRPLDGADGAAEDVPLLEGLEATPLAPADLAVHVEPLPGVERTQLESQMDVAQHWTAGPIALERTAHDAAPDTPAAAGADMEVDLGRADEVGERTAAPAETAICPFCGTPSLDPICDTCGRRKFAFAAAVEQTVRAATGETTVCPACFARVAKDVRCSDCGMPFPLQEL